MGFCNFFSVLSHCASLWLRLGLRNNNIHFAIYCSLTCCFTSYSSSAQLRSSPRTPAPPTPPLTCRGAGRGENHVASSCSSNTSHKLTTYRVGEEVRPLYVPLGLVGDLLSHLGYVLLGHHFPHSLLHL